VGGRAVGRDCTSTNKKYHVLMDMGRATEHTAVVVSLLVGAQQAWTLARLVLTVAFAQSSGAELERGGAWSGSCTNTSWCTPVVTLACRVDIARHMPDALTMKGVCCVRCLCSSMLFLEVLGPASTR